MEFALVRLLFLALFSVSFAAINLDIRTRGVPKSDTNEGNRFCFSFITNKEPVDNLRVLTIFIGTQERENVQYRIRSGTPDVSRNGTVSPGEIIQEQFYDSNMQTDTGSTRARNDLTGIIVETVNSSQKIAVSGFNDATGSSEGFAAVPMFNVPSFTKSYNYTIFADGPESPVSAMVACGHIEAGGVTIDNTSPTTVRPRGGYFRSRVRNGQTVSSSIDFEEYYNPVLTNNDDEISGLRVFATVPIGFMVGHECGEIPLGKLNCDHLLEQMPPSYTWGYNFLIAPYHSRYAGYIVKVLGGYKTDTNFRLFCDNGTAIAVDNYVDIQSRTPNKGVFDITTQSFCTIQSNRPLAVIQYAKGHDVDDDDTRKEKDFADPQMTWIPSVSQYLNRYLMSNNVSSRPLSAQHFTSNGLYVTVLPECFNTSAILDNGTPIERDTCKWSRFYCNNFTDVCGYGISVEVSQARHLLRHMDSRCTFGAVMFGWGNEKGYGFPAGFGMAPIGVPVYSIEPLIASAVESSTGPVSVIVYKSGDISQASSVVISTFSSSKSNAATIGQNLVSQTRTVDFAAGQSSANVAFTFSDDTSPETNEVFMVGFVDGQDIAIGTPSAAELGIIEDIAALFSFSRSDYSVPENGSSIVLSIVKEGNTLQPLSIFIETFDITAYAGSDYTPINRRELTFINESSQSIVVFIHNDTFLESSETFGVRLTAVQSQAIITQPIVIVTIGNDDKRSLQDHHSVQCYTSISNCNGQKMELLLQLLIAVVKDTLDITH